MRRFLKRRPFERQPSVPNPRQHLLTAALVFGMALVGSRDKPCHLIPLAILARLTNPCADVGDGLNAQEWGTTVLHARATPERLSAFSDGVFAVLTTVLVLELRPPGLPTFKALLLLWPTWLSYAVSYLFIAIVWTNHHHLMR
jgi:hypothetical protein